MSLENLQTLSKLSPNSKKICVHNFFFENNMRSTTQKNSKKVVNAYFFEFGESLEILQTHVFPIFFFNPIFF